MIEIAQIVETTLVPHTAFAEASRRLEQCFVYAARAREPICLPIIGESRTGKSRVTEECFDAHPKYREAEGARIPILRVSTPQLPTVKGLVEVMLEEMGDPKTTAGTEITKTTRLLVLMRSAGTRMVMIDEFQHFVERGSNRVQHLVADWLKLLADKAKIALVVSGLPTCTAVLNQNEQLAGRFQSPVLMPRFDWRNEGQREEFVGILYAFQQSFAEHFDLPRFDTPEMAFRFYCATSGLMGYLTRLLSQTVRNALDNNTRTVTLEALYEANEQVLWKLAAPKDIVNPFSKEFSTLPTESLLAQIRLIGTRKEDKVEATSTARRRVGKGSAVSAPQSP